MNKKIPIIIIGLGLCLIGAITATNNNVSADDAYVDHYTGGGNSEGTTPSPSTPSGPTSCGINAWQSGQIDCTGSSWIFYKHMDGAPVTSIKFPIEDNIGDDQLPEIPAFCAKGTNAGFWHYGRNAMGTTRGSWGRYTGLRSDSYNSLSSQFTYSTSMRTWGHWSQHTYKYLDDKFYSVFRTSADNLNRITYNNGQSMGTPNHILYKNGTAIYKAESFATSIDGSNDNSMQDVLTAYNDLLHSTGNRKVGSMPTDISAFCWNKEMASGGRYSGTVTVSVNGKIAQNGETITVQSEYSDVTFDHLIKRNNTDFNSQSNNNWQVNGDNGSFSGTATFQKSQEGQLISVKKASEQKRLGQGETKRYCSTLTYNDDFSNDGNGTGSAQAQICVYLTRGKNDQNGVFQTDQSCHLEAGGHSLDGCGQKLYTNSRNWSIKHVGQVYSSDGRSYPDGVPANTKDSTASIGDTDINGYGYAGDKRYSHPAQTYGINDTCVRSRTSYTEWWFNAGNGWTEGNTLSESGTDLAFDGGADNKMVKSRTHWSVWWGENNNGPWNDPNSCQSANGNKPCRNESGDTNNPGWYFGEICGDGKKPWYTFNGTNLESKGAKGEWGQNDDPSLLLINDTDNDDEVSLSRTSSMVANSTYPWTNTGAGVDSSTGRSWSTVTSTIVRIRRHFPFDNNAAELKANTGLLREASTPRSNMYTLDTTNSNGEFTITFGYEIVRGATRNAVDPGAEHYPVQNSWSSYESITADDGSGRTYRINGDYNVTHSYPNFTTNSPGNTSGRKYETVKGTLYYGQQVIICGNLKFGDSIRELDDGAEIESWAERRGEEVGCIKVIRNKRGCGSIVGANSAGYDFSHMYGYNVARIGVQNSSISNDYHYTNWTPDQAHTTGLALTNTEIFARPGDTVRYKVDYCMGANYAHAVHEANGINDGGVDTTMHVNGDSSGKTNFADTTDRISADKRSNYLFGDTLGSYNGTKTTPTIFNYIKRDSNGRIDETASIDDNNNINTKYSPQLDENISRTYSCPIGGGNTSGTDQHYQIAGKVTNKNGDYSVIDECSTNRTQSLDVGRTLSEKLIWTDMSFTNDVYHANVNGDYLSNAYIRVPYNYTAKPYLTTNNSPKGTVQIGGKLTTTPGIAVFPRKNCAFITDGVTIATKNDCEANNNPNATYATVTKPTTVKLEAYVNNDSRIFQTDSYVVRANTKSNRKGSTAGGDYSTASLMGGGTKLDSDYVVDVPNDVNPGDKICVRMTITPADSHNYPGESLVFGASPQGTGTEETDPTKPKKFYWALREDGTSTATAISCSTAVKRPTISIEDSNLYSASNITTSVVSRNNYTSGGIRHANNGTKYYLFGSWSEYGIFGKVTTGNDGSVNISTLGTASGASLGYSQTSYLNSHKTTVTGYNAQPLTVVTYNGGPKNGTYEYNYSRITRNSSQTRIVYEYETKEDGSRYYRLASKTNQTIAPSSYTFANSPIVNAADSRGVAEKTTKICTHSTQTFANVDCDDGKIGSDKIGADAVDVFTTNILDRYGDAKMPYTKTDGAEVINGYTNLTETSAVAEQLDGDEGAAMFKNIKGKAFLGYKDGHAVDYDSLAVKNNGNVEGADTNLTAKSVMVYKADTVVINSSLIANNDEKTGSGDFRMPIIIANKVWFTGNPTRVDAIIIAKEELNTCKWNSYNDFLSNVLPSFPTKKNGLASNKANEMSSNICNNELRFTAPVVVKGKLILNRTYGAGGTNNGGDQMRRAEIFELNAATYLWSFAEMSRYSQAITTYSRELPSRY